MNQVNERNMRKGDIKNGKVFTVKDKDRTDVLEIKKEHGNITLQKKKMFAGHVTNIMDDGLDVTIFIASMEVKYRLEFKNCFISY